MRIFVAPAILCLVFCGLAINCGSGGNSTPTRPAAKAPPPPIDPAMQADRKAFIQDRMNDGFFKKLETPGSLPHLWVTPSFLMLDYDTKTSLVNVVFAYCYPQYNGEYGSILVLKHSITGKRIGTYSSSGLDLD